MKSTAEKELRHIISRADYITAQKATELAAAQGCLAVGTALSEEGYTPTIPLNSRKTSDGQGRAWRPWITNERGGTFPIVRAGNVGKTAVWGAFGGNVNESFQRTRIGKPLLPEDKLYDLGSHGWHYNMKAGVYIPEAHPDLLAAGRQLDPDTVIGAIDFVIDDGSFTIAAADEPGHYGSTHQHDRVATMPVRMGDVLAEFDTVSTAGLDYVPIQL